MRILSLCVLFAIGLTPTAITGLLAISMVGQPVLCHKPDCQGKTYGAELLFLPASTLAPLVCGLLIATVGSKKKQPSSVKSSPAKAVPPMPVARRRDETAA
jgi:hypothetical protein